MRKLFLFLIVIWVICFGYVSLTDVITSGVFYYFIIILVFIILFFLCLYWLGYIQVDTTHKSHELSFRISKYNIIITLCLFSIFSGTNPTLEEHRDKVRSVVNDNMNKVVQQRAEKQIYMKSSSDMVKPAIRNVIENIITRENYIIFSLTHIKIGEKEKNIGIGILGKVYLFKEKIDLREKMNNI